MPSAACLGVQASRRFSCEFSAAFSSMVTKLQVIQEHLYQSEIKLVGARDAQPLGDHRNEVMVRLNIRES